MNKFTFYGFLIIDVLSVTNVVNADQIILNSQLQSDSCIIGGVWYERGETNPTNCLICDPEENRYDWTIRYDVCYMPYGLCYDHGTRHPSGCAECDTGRSMTSWSVDSGKCLIGGQCYDSGYFSGCATCLPESTQTTWIVEDGYCAIGNNCFTQGWPHLCAVCDPLVSKTKWTQVPDCYVILMIALNEPHDGNLGGKEVADCLCARDAQAAGLNATWKAFLSSSSGNAVDLIHDSLRTGVPVVNNQGWRLYDNWSDMFAQTGWFQGAYIYSFRYHKVKDPVWYDARGWHGSYPDGTLRPDCNCRDWTSNASSDHGANGKLNTPIQWLSDQTTPCDSMLAVLCITVDEKTPTAVDDESNNTALPDRPNLLQNYPNPFNPTTTVEYSLCRSDHARMTIYNLLGQQVRVLVDETRPAGIHRAKWDGRDDNGNSVASGIYVYRLETDDRDMSKKMVLLR